MIWCQFTVKSAYSLTQRGNLREQNLICKWMVLPEQMGFSERTNLDKKQLKIFFYLFIHSYLYNENLLFITDKKKTEKV